MKINFVQVTADFNLRNLKPSIKWNNFPEEVKRALGFDHSRKTGKKQTKSPNEDDDYDAWAEFRPSFRPDYFCIETIDEVVTVSIYEVEDTHPLTSSKIRDIVEWWFDLDSMAVDVKLFVTDRYGLNIREIMLEPLWLAFTRQEYNEEIRERKRNGSNKR